MDEQHGVTRGGATMAGGDVVCRCSRCGLGYKCYAGRYKSKCPQCGGPMSKTESAGEPVIACVSMAPRVQRIIDAGAPAAAPGPRSSRSFVVQAHELERRLPGGLEALTSYMEGPVGGRYYRVESPRDPIIIAEVNDGAGRVRLWATEDPARYLGCDPRREFVDTDIIPAELPEADARIRGLERLAQSGDTAAAQALAAQYLRTRSDPILNELVARFGESDLAHTADYVPTPGVLMQREKAKQIEDALALGAKLGKRLGWEPQPAYGHRGTTDDVLLRNEYVGRTVGSNPNTFGMHLRDRGGDMAHHVPWDEADARYAALARALRDAGFKTRTEKGRSGSEKGHVSIIYVTFLKGRLAAMRKVHGRYEDWLKMMRGEGLGIGTEDDPDAPDDLWDELRGDIKREVRLGGGDKWFLTTERNRSPWSEGGYLVGHEYTIDFGRSYRSADRLGYLQLPNKDGVQRGLQARLTYTDWGDGPELQRAVARTVAKRIKAPVALVDEDGLNPNETIRESLELEEGAAAAVRKLQRAMKGIEDDIFSMRDGAPHKAGLLSAARFVRAILKRTGRGRIMPGTVRELRRGIGGLARALQGAEMDTRALATAARELGEALELGEAKISPKARAYIERKIRHLVHKEGMKPKDAIGPAYAAAREAGFDVPLGKKGKAGESSPIPGELYERGGAFGGVGHTGVPSWDHARSAAIEAAQEKGKEKRKTGDGQTSPYSGFTIHVGANQNRKPRKDVKRALQNKRNARRGLAKRVRAAKDWHRSPEGARLHTALGRYNERPSGSAGQVRRLYPHGAAPAQQRAARLAASIERWRPTQHLLEATSQYAETIDDVLDDLLRKLLVIESLDILQDVEFDESSGSIYLFFDPSLDGEEVTEVHQVLQSAHSDLALVASPDRSLPGEQHESDWWVMFLPRAQEGVQPPAPDPNIYANDEAPGPQLRQTFVVQTPMSSAEQAADAIDVDALLGEIGGATAESLSRLPQAVQSRLAARMRGSNP